MIWVILSVLLRNTREPLLENIKKADPVWKTGNSLKPKLIFGIVPGGMHLYPRREKELYSFFKKHQICRRYDFFRRKKTTENYSRIFMRAMVMHFMHLLLLYRHENRIFVIQAGYRLVIPGPLCCASRVKWMMEWLLIRLSSPWQKTVRTYCSRTPQKIRNLFFSFVSSILTKFLVCYNKIRS